MLYDELSTIYDFTEKERNFFRSRQGKTELSLAALLKYFQLNGCFPENMHDIPVHILQYISSMLDISIPIKNILDISSRTYERYRAKIREFLGFRPASLQDDDVAILHLQKVIDEHHIYDEHDLRDKLLQWYKEQSIEPIGITRQSRIIRAAIHNAQQFALESIAGQLSSKSCEAIDMLLSRDDHPESGGRFSDLKDDTGGISLARVEREIEKLTVIDKLDISGDVLDRMSPSLIQKYYLRINTESVRDLRIHPAQQRYAMMAIYCTIRKTEIIDSFVNTLIHLIHKLKATAERRVTKQLVKDFKLIRGKNALLAQIAEIALEHPDLTMEEALYTTIGKDKLKALVQEYRHAGPAFKHEVQMIIHSSYKAHYRKMLPLILEALSFRSNNHHYRPIIEALDYLKTITGSKKRYLMMDEVPLKGVVPKDMQPLVIESLPDGSQRIHRIHYEICVLQALRDKLRCKEIWVEDAKEFCNPDDDVPQDFDEKREDYYQQLGQPLDAQAFIDSLKKQLTDELGVVEIT